MVSLSQLSFWTSILLELRREKISFNWLGLLDLNNLFDAPTCWKFVSIHFPNPSRQHREDQITIKCSLEAFGSTVQKKAIDLGKSTVVTRKFIDAIYCQGSLNWTVFSSLPMTNRSLVISKNIVIQQHESGYILFFLNWKTTRANHNGRGANEKEKGCSARFPVPWCMGNWPIFVTPFFFQVWSCTAEIRSFGTKPALWRSGNGQRWAQSESWMRHSAL